MKWRGLYWLCVLLIAVVLFITVLVRAPGDNADCRFDSSAKGCEAGANLGVGLVVTMGALLLVAWCVERIARWLWRKWQQRGPTYI